MKYKVSIKGKQHEVELKDNSAKIGDEILNFREEKDGVLINERLYKVEFQNGKYEKVKVNDNVYDVKIEEEKFVKEEKKVKEEKAEVKTLKGAIYPPMPGKIISVKVKSGDKVKKGEILLILEAMKMQNEIRAEFEGIVKEVKVKNGDAVSANDVLVVVD